MSTLPSVYFYTFHKCASTLFASYVLQNLKSLRHVDYAGEIYRGGNVGALTFENDGHVYGPIRLSAEPDSPVYRWFVGPVSRPAFVRDKSAMFLVRDPRDILVSTYYSFGFTHEFSTVPEIQRIEQGLRANIRSQTIDDYALASAKRVLRHFETLNALAEAYARPAILRYEDMIDDWDRFARTLVRQVDVEEAVLTQIYQRSRPRSDEDINAHRRSGKPQGFRSKLKQETIAALDTVFAPVLDRYGFRGGAGSAACW